MRRSHTLPSRAAALLLGTLLTLALVLAPSTTATAEDVWLDSEQLSAGRVRIEIHGCDDPALVSGSTIDIRQNGTHITTLTAAPSTTVLEWQTPRPGIYEATLTCLAYNSDEIYGQSTAQLYNQITLYQGQVHRCIGTTATFTAAGLPPGLVLDASWIEVSEGDLIARLPGVVTVDRNGAITVALRIPASGYAAPEVSIPEFGGATVALIIGTPDSAYAFTWFVTLKPADECAPQIVPPAVPPGLPDTGA